MSGAQQHDRAASAISHAMPELVKGAGFAMPRGNKPLEDTGEILKRAHAAETALIKAVRTGIDRPQDVIKSLSPSFATEFGLFLQQMPGQGGLESFRNEVQVALSELGKNITLTSPLSTGLVPYDLVAPARLIYPVFSPLRNKFPRTGGKGTSRRVKLYTGITGSQAGGAPAIQRVSIAEMVGGSLSNWPANLPGSGSQNAVDMNIPYKFFGMTEALSWLSQFAGQGFEDISALANLILLQQFMMAEEYQMLSSTGTALSAPGTPTLASRSAGSSETGLTGVTTNVFVKVTAKNLYGETVASTGASVASSNGNVVDVTIAPVKGAAYYNIYVTTGTAAGTYFLMASNVGAAKFTLQGALPTGGTTPPTADTGTASSNDYEGIWSILSGHASTDASVYPANFFGGYFNGAVGKTLSHTVLFDALQHMWDGTATLAEGFRGDPAELVCEGSDARRLADDVLNTNNAGLNYRLSLTESDQPGVRIGAAVSEIQNPITRSTVALVVHPWYPQGNADLFSYALPHPQSNVTNIWENVMVQDYLSISWPVIDASFRFSMFQYGSLVCYAPQYNGHLGGLQQSAVTPYS